MNRHDAVRKLTGQHPLSWKYVKAADSEGVTPEFGSIRDAYGQVIADRILKRDADLLIAIIEDL